ANRASRTKSPGRRLASSGGFFLPQARAMSQAPRASRHPFRNPKETQMKPRLNPFAAAPAAMQSWLDFGQKMDFKLEDSLIELVKIRASQINGCGFCIHMHTTDARKHGEAEERIYLLDA